MSLELKNLTKRFGDVEAVTDINMEVDTDEFLVLLGPSGSGKTTTLRMIAGLETPTEGEVIINGEVVNERAPSERDIAMVFQNYALYPHMTTRENMSIPLRVAGYEKERIREIVDETAEMLGIDALMDRKPSELSGGQQQRVALGRAIVRDPTVSLLDEPLSNLDAKLRMEMRKELMALHENLEHTTFVYVTHDQIEAMTMATKIAVLDGGKLQQLGTPEQLFDEPANVFVAKFIGSPSMNLFECSVEERSDGPVFDFGPFEYPIENGLYEAVQRHQPEHPQVGIRPNDIVIEPDGRFTGDVRFTEPTGAEMLVYFNVGGLEFVAEKEREGRVSDGDRIRFDFSPEKVHVFQNGDAIAHGEPVREKDRMVQ